MKSLLIAIGKTDETYLNAGIDKFADRIAHYAPFEFKILPDVKRTKGITEEQQKSAEANMLLAELTPADIVVLLDEKGREYTSVEFATYINKVNISGAKRLVFIIGGPYGFSQQIYDRANDKISLSRMTFSHQMVRLIFLEQLYRAHTILRGEPYHHQ